MIIYNRVVQEEANVASPLEADLHVSIHLFPFKYTSHTVSNPSGDNWAGKNLLIVFSVACIARKSVSLLFSKNRINGAV